MSSLWQVICGQAGALYAGLLFEQRRSDRNQGTFHIGGPQKGSRDVGAMAGCGLQAGVPAGQQAIEVKRHALLDVGGVEGDPVAHRKAGTQRVDEIAEIWPWNVKRPDGSYCYSEAFRRDKELEVTSEAQSRKDTPVFSGVLQYFPKALAEVARVSRIGNEQHNPGSPLHWDRSKSGDELDALTRHLMDAGTLDTDGTRHSAKVAWRALANLEKELENE